VANTGHANTQQLMCTMLLLQQTTDVVHTWRCVHEGRPCSTKGRPLQFMPLPTEMLEGRQCSIALSFLFMTGDIIPMHTSVMQAVQKGNEGCQSAFAVQQS